jgi:uncharacterized membrane protein YphA (DoxX/SURF4 family)
MALGFSYLWFVADRLGFLGPPGSPHVGWGDWMHFFQYASQVLSFIPAVFVHFFAVLATVGEFVFGFLMVIGLFTRFAAFGSGLLSFLFACSMGISFGIESPLGYSVFAVSAGSFLLAVVPYYKWSIDAWLEKRRKKRIEH